MIKERLIKFSNILQEHQLDAIFIINKANIRYLSGYTGDDAYLFITPKRRALITDSRYTEPVSYTHLIKILSFSWRICSFFK